MLWTLDCLLLFSHALTYNAACMRKLYYESDCVRISFNETQQLGVAEWNGFLSSKDFRENALRCLELIERYELRSWLGDNRKMKAIRQADQQWMVEEFIPKLLDSSLRRLANLVSEDIFNKMAIEQMIKRAGPLEAILIRDFDSEAAAMAWLVMPEKDVAVQQTYKLS